VKSAKLDLSEIRGSGDDVDPERLKCLELYLKLKGAIEAAQDVRS